MYRNMHVYPRRGTNLNTDVCDKSISAIEECPFSPVLINYIVNTIQLILIRGVWIAVNEIFVCVISLKDYDTVRMYCGCQFTCTCFYPADFRLWERCNLT
jgi:hypothetical protein